MISAKSQADLTRSILAIVNDYNVDYAVDYNVDYKVD